MHNVDGMSALCCPLDVATVDLVEAVVCASCTAREYEAAVTDGIAALSNVDLARAYGDLFLVAVTVCVACVCPELEGAVTCVPVGDVVVLAVWDQGGGDT